MAITKPIWEDTTYAESLSDSFYEYHLDNDDDILYAGKAYKYPDQNIGEVLINDIAENYLSNHIKFVEGTSTMEGYCKDFDLVTSTGNTTSFTFYNDWSYNPINTSTTKHRILNDPITKKIDSRQYFFLNILNLSGTGSVSVKLNGASQGSISLSGIRGISYVKKFTAACGSVMNVETSDKTESLSYSFDSKDYCLYYVNAYGGWDSLLIDGNTKRTDQITASENYVKKAKSNSLEFGKTKYLNTIVPSWTLYTGYMTDEQASKMHHLIESTEVYLHNLNDDTIIPVLITDTQCEYLTYTNNGRKLPSYTINVEASQEQYKK